MRFGVQERLLLWLVLVILPVALVGWIVVERVDDRLSERIETDLSNVRRLEAARITEALASYERDARSLAAGPHVRDFVAGVTAARSGTLPAGETIGGYDGFSVVDADAARPLGELAAALQKKAQTTGSEVAALRLVGRDGSVLGESAGFTWVPDDPGAVDRAMALGSPVFGNAFRPPSGDDRLGLVAPIFDASNDVVGALVMEIHLGPIVNAVVEHEGFGETSEAHIAQATPDGDAQFITPLRFEPDAAFAKVVPVEKGLPINQSLLSPGGQTVRSPDYRKADSILAIETLEPVGWGLVVKIDADEAFAPLAEVKRLALLADLVAALVALVGWLILVRPLGRRLKGAARAAERVADGEYRVALDDRGRDEIGDLARTIDRLAAELDEDISKRTAVEQQLRHQASHDELTGLRNRKHVAELIDRLAARGTFSVLFLDLDGFKGVNDVHGHAVGDQALVAVARRLVRAVDDGATVARWGGDEFLVVLPECDAEQATRVAEQVRGIFGNPISTSAGAQHVSCSLGVATSEPGGTVDQLLNRADARMFAEKDANGARRASAARGARSGAGAPRSERVDA
jgi:diguanylate cyclase (GGDEF)-like protein